MATVIRNILGYLATLLRSRLKLADRSTSLEDIFNYLELDNRITTSGQPSATQLGLIKAAGYTTIINLAPKAQENALEDEEEILQRLGIRYFHLPVVFSRPTREDFERFIETLEACNDERLWVHCAANMRVSAFFFKYRTERLSWPIERAQSDLDKIWKPNKVWRDFIDRG